MNEELADDLKVMRKVLMSVHAECCRKSRRHRLAIILNNEVCRFAITNSFVIVLIDVIVEIINVNAVSGLRARERRRVLAVTVLLIAALCFIAIGSRHRLSAFLTFSRCHK